MIGLAGPAGTDLGAVARGLTEELKAFNYHAVTIRVSDILKEWCSGEVRAAIESSKEDKRIDYSMNAADSIREAVGSGAALVPLILTALRYHRQQFFLQEYDVNCDFEEIELYNHCFIINSLKHPDEVRVLRRIYGPKFIMLSAFSSLEERKGALCKSIAKSYGKADSTSYADQANRLIEKDKKRSDTAIGQNLSGTFHKADFFLRADGSSRGDIERFFQVVFGHPNATPRRDEYLMFEAQANALRSADLSRQVGAVIANEDLEVVSRGCNEVPIVGGDTYWPGDKKEDTRDYEKGKDYNAIKKIEILKELIEYLFVRGLIKLEDSESEDDLVKELVFGKHKRTFRDIRMSNLIEFGRIVHAEMFALMEAARRGLSVKRGSLYCTTFPCHMCARHIIAAGIHRVIYIEPYPKSMTEELYGDMISIDVEPKVAQIQRDTIPKKVYFQPFEGVAPRMYVNAFVMPLRKNDDGYRVEWSKDSAKPKWIALSMSHLELEVAMSHTLSKIPKASDLSRITGE